MGFELVRSNWKASGRSGAATIGSQNKLWLSKSDCEQIGVLSIDNKVDFLVDSERRLFRIQPGNFARMLSQNRSSVTFSIWTATKLLCDDPESLRGRYACKVVDGGIEIDLSKKL